MVQGQGEAPFTSNRELLLWYHRAVGILEILTLYNRAEQISDVPVLV